MKPFELYGAQLGALNVAGVALKPAQRLRAYSTSVSFVVPNTVVPEIERFQGLMRAQVKRQVRDRYCQMCADLFSGPGVAARAIIMVNR